MALEAFLISMTGKGKRCLLIVDEAQNLTARAVEELRMLSNFQFGNHALLQSFLIGQPEFRKVLQSPQMMQFRQRVIASCHIGPMDVEETRGYVEHRLKHAGSTGCPVFSEDSFEAIFKASSGIPRRINSICDRLLLSGYLSDKKEFRAADVENIAGEIAEETQGTVPAQRSEVSSEATENNPQTSQTNTTVPLIAAKQERVNSPDADISSRDELNRLLGGLNAWQLNERLGRLEQGLQQLEMINGKTLSLLQRLVPSIVPPDSKPQSRERK